MNSQLDEASSTVTSSAPPSGLKREGREDVLVAVCSDLVSGRSGARLVAAIESLVDGRCRGKVRVIKNLCSAPAKLSVELDGSGADRIVVACRRGASIRDEVTMLARRRAIHPAGVAVVELSSAPRASKRAVAAHSIVQIHAALEGALAGDLASPVNERRSSAAKQYSRRNLFHVRDITQPLSAGWNGERCQGTGRRRACVEACPIGALQLVGGRVEVDSGRCTGCGACLSVCPSAAMSVGGTTVATHESVLKAVISELSDLDSRAGLALICENASTKTALGGEWLSVGVPSLETVSVGWLLQILASGISVRLAGCTQERCGTRAGPLVEFCQELLADSRLAGLVEVRWGAAQDPLSAEMRFVRPMRSPSGQHDDITLREPEATRRALTNLAVRPSATNEDGTPTESVANRASDPHTPLRFESQLSPVGELSIVEDKCSACGNCALACPTGALARDNSGEASAFVLTLDPAACTACGACVPSCPERAITLRRVIDVSDLRPSRKTVAVRAIRGRCTVCGNLLVEGLAASKISDLLGDSHRALADLLVRSDTCLACQFRPGSAWG